MKFLGTEIGKVTKMTESALKIIGDACAESGADIRLSPKKPGYYIGCAGTDTDAQVIYLNTRKATGQELIRISCGIIIGVGTGSLTMVDSDADDASFTYRFPKNPRTDDTEPARTLAKLKSDLPEIGKVLRMIAACQK